MKNCNPIKYRTLQKPLVLKGKKEYFYFIIQMYNILISFYCTTHVLMESSKNSLKFLSCTNKRNLESTSLQFKILESNQPESERQ